jgi:anhydro-N-acetylmuramic acid kinase
MKPIHTIGIMSGSSLDGIDLVHCEFLFNQNQLAHWKLHHNVTLPFTEQWKERLIALPNSSARELIHAHTDLGHFIGKCVLDFIRDFSIENIDLIASHGHTLFHEPKSGYTCQIGDGAAIAAESRIPAICDFRASDVALGGQGAPLAPLADRMIFPGYDYYLNIGGIANITAAINGKYIAFDICGANQILNALASLEGKTYDHNGELAASGEFIPSLFDGLNNELYFNQPYPKSLSNQWIQQNSVKTCLSFSANTSDRLNTACHHIAFQLKKSIGMVSEKELFQPMKSNLFATGGGALNLYLMDLIASKIPNISIVIPKPEIVKAKEGILMALMGALRWKEIPNCISTVTGAAKNAIGGAVYLP